MKLGARDQGITFVRKGVGQGPSGQTELADLDEVVVPETSSTQRVCDRLTLREQLAGGGNVLEQFPVDRVHASFAVHLFELDRCVEGIGQRYRIALLAVEPLDLRADLAEQITAPGLDSLRLCVELQGAAYQRQSSGVRIIAVKQVSEECRHCLVGVGRDQKVREAVRLDRCLALRAGGYVIDRSALPQRAESDWSLAGNLQRNRKTASRGALADLVPNTGLCVSIQAGDAIKPRLGKLSNITRTDTIERWLCRANRRVPAENNVGDETIVALVRRTENEHLLHGGLRAGGQRPQHGDDKSDDPRARHGVSVLTRVCPCP